MMNKMSRQEAADLLDNLLGMVEDNHGSNYDEALRMGIRALTKAVEVVRCKDCSACSTAGDYLVCLRFGFITDYNRYCAWGGELKEE